MRARGWDKIARHLVAGVMALVIQSGLVVFLVSVNHHQKPNVPPPLPRKKRVLTLRTRPKPPPQRMMRQTKKLQARSTPSLLPALKIPSPVALPYVPNLKQSAALGLLHPGENLGGGTGGGAPTLQKNMILTEDLVDVPPKVIAKVPPRYPAHAELQHIQGYVELRLVVSAQGRVERVVVVESKPPGVFQAAAVRAVMQWRFKPAVFQGRPTRVWASQRLNFKLEE